MSFSWWCSDSKGKDLFEEFEIHYQAMGLADSTEDVRNAFTAVPYSATYEKAAVDAIRAAQAVVAENLMRYTGPKHPECPSCRCPCDPPESPFGTDIEQAKRFLALPLDRVWRAGGGW